MATYSCLRFIMRSVNLAESKYFERYLLFHAKLVDCSSKKQPRFRDARWSARRDQCLGTPFPPFKGSFLGQALGWCGWRRLCIRRDISNNGLTALLTVYVLVATQGGAQGEGHALILRPAKWFPRWPDGGSFVFDAIHL